MLFSHTHSELGFKIKNYQIRSKVGVCYKYEQFNSDLLGLTEKKGR